MSKTTKPNYLPDYIVTPGEILSDYLESLGMTQAELSQRSGLTEKTISEIIQGKSALTPETALKLEYCLGRPAHFWNNLEMQYRQDCTRLAAKEQLVSDLDWLKSVPVNALIKLGWMEKREDKISQVEECLKYYGVASREQWEQQWNRCQAAYRQTKRFESCAEAVSAWLRRGEIEAQGIASAPFDKQKFIAILEQIRPLTKEPPQVFIPQLKALCASVGVVILFIPELPKCRVSGVTRWLGDKAVIQLSLRYKSNDHLWFTFFHESGHIIKHGRKDIFIETNGLDGEKEDEANLFASNILIPSLLLHSFLQNWNKSNREIVLFAQKINIAPGIVVGRLQHDKNIPRTQGNDLKVFYQWVKP
jgi:HTH-type transcriptional regulator / antitoxin HigA